MRPEFVEADVKIAYGIARDIARGTLTASAGKQRMIEELDAAPYTALQFIEAYPAMLEGGIYGKTLSDLAVRIYVEAITAEYGLPKRTLAVQAVLKNLDYYEEHESKRLGRPVVRKSQRALCQRLLATTPPTVVYPDEVEHKTYIEGAVLKVLVNRYERDPKARAAAIAHYGCVCCVCGFDFEAKFGKPGRGFIHVHHVVDLATINGEYKVDPVKDLRPVCPNCHAMLHTENPAMEVSVLQELMAVLDFRK
ncbi:HNH endonuclease [Paraburkholderia fungorum]|uniref:HNH endonuclease n=1 Tax=Paraburkholderia fungorum TaxID=134537 RepID=UPI001C1ED54A|nr:HNH endonuclease [Paraburkholderia fungorum]MBU7440914.1 HNH endonuclease [Paraburkholderia fungorum]